MVSIGIGLSGLLSILSTILTGLLTLTITK